MEKLEPYALLVQNGASTMENSMDIPEKIKKCHYHKIQQSHFWIYIYKRVENRVSKR
jgi:hypothetical protein